MKWCLKTQILGFSFAGLSCTHVELGQPMLAPSQAALKTTMSVEPLQAIEAAVKARRGELDDCYKQERNRNPAAEGRVLISFTVLKNGRTSEVRLLASSIQSPIMEGCLVSRVEAWHFQPLASGETLKLRYPFSFKP